MTYQLNLRTKYLFQLLIQLNCKFLQTKKKSFVSKTVAFFPNDRITTSYQKPNKVPDKLIFLLKYGFKSRAKVS